MIKTSKTLSLKAVLTFAKFPCVAFHAQVKLDPRCQIYKMADAWKPCGH